MGANSGCVETARSGDNYYLLDAKDRAIGPVDVISAADYAKRHEAAVLRGDPTIMFSEPEIQKNYSLGEITAYNAYLATGRLALLGEGEVVSAYENMHDLASADVVEVPTP